jgi:UDP-2-acetamido-3-amino-2,3-dideoxy-glucuronate N-acetyltransferase
VAAGAVVTGDVPDYALVMGNPGRQKGWMSRHGHKLNPSGNNGTLVCPESGYRYQLAPPPSAVSPASPVLRCLDCDEEAPLPEALARGTQSYEFFKSRGEGLKA